MSAIVTKLLLICIELLFIAYISFGLSIISGLVASLLSKLCVKSFRLLLSEFPYETGCHQRAACTELRALYVQHLNMHKIMVKISGS